MTTPAQRQQLAASLILAEAARHGVRTFFLSPGSRSTPLALAAAEHDEIELHVAIDERGAAFAALGAARASGRPSGLICTSGTAVVNYLPAVVEAAADLVPLLLLTADRPAELRGTGANQTIDQLSCFSPFLKFQADLACFTEQLSAADLLETVDLAMANACHLLSRGPVQLNCQFAEPLIDTECSLPIPESLSPWKDSRKPYRTIPLPLPDVPQGTIDECRRLLGACSRGLIVIGALATLSDQLASTDLANALGWPVIADVTSGLTLRAGLQHRIDFAELRLRKLLVGPLAPDLILHLGRELVSKELIRLIGSGAIPVINASGSLRPYDPSRAVTHHLPVPIEKLAALFAGATEQGAPGDNPERAVCEQIDQQIGARSSASERLTEIAAMRTIVSQLPEQSAVVVASSLPIRLLNTFCRAELSDIRVFANRGASGIDGTIATAVGVAIGSARPVSLLIGDLAFLHDLNSLLLCRSVQSPLVIVVLNNNGGGIFGHLPIASQSDQFESLFLTPHHLTFRSAADFFLLRYLEVSSLHLLADQYRQAIRRTGCTIIELPLDRELDLFEQRRIRSAVSSMLELP